MLRKSVPLVPLLLSLAVMALPQAPDVTERIDGIHGRYVFADTHAHLRRFHRANVPKIAVEELERYRRARMDGHRPGPREPHAFTLVRFSRILKNIEDGDAVLAGSPVAVVEAGS